MLKEPRRSVTLWDEGQALLLLILLMLLCLLLHELGEDELGSIGESVFSGSLRPCVVASWLLLAELVDMLRGGAGESAEEGVDDVEDDPFEG